MATYETDNFTGRIPPPTLYNAGIQHQIPVILDLAKLTGGVALAANDIIKLCHLPAGFKAVGAQVCDPEGLVATFDLGFGELIADGFAFDATGDEIIDGGDVTTGPPVVGNNQALASEVIQDEYDRPIHLKAVTVGGVPPTEGKAEILIFTRPATVGDRWYVN